MNEERRLLPEALESNDELADEAMPFLARISHQLSASRRRSGHVQRSGDHPGGLGIVNGNPGRSLGESELEFGE